MTDSPNIPASRFCCVMGGNTHPTTNVNWDCPIIKFSIVQMHWLLWLVVTISLYKCTDSCDWLLLYHCTNALTPVIGCYYIIVQVHWLLWLVVTISLYKCTDSCDWLFLYHVLSCQVLSFPITVLWNIINIGYVILKMYN